MWMTTSLVKSSRISLVRRRTTSSLSSRYYNNGTVHHWNHYYYYNQFCSIQNYTNNNCRSNVKCSMQNASSLLQIYKRMSYTAAICNNINYDDDDDDLKLDTSFLAKILPGINNELANRIVDHYDQKTLQSILFDNEASNLNKLMEVKGIGPKKIEKIQELFKQPGYIDLCLLIGPLDIVDKYCLEVIFNKYKEKSAEYVKNNPYQLLRDFPYYGKFNFINVDEIALRVGIPKDSDIRLLEGMSHILLNDNNGNTAIPIYSLSYKLGKLLQFVTKDDKCKSTSSKNTLRYLQGRITSIYENNSDGIIQCVQSRKCLYVQHDVFKEAESKIASRIKSMQTTPSVLDQKSLLFMADYFKVKHNHLSEEQWDAIKNVFKEKVSIITGGPGTGKTSLVRALVDVVGPGNIKLMAPTGRAASRLKSSTDHHAGTIHLAIGRYIDKENKEKRTWDSDLDYPLLLVDESSMVDTFLAASLLETINSGSHIVFIGDVDQLEPVGPGKVMSDLIKVGIPLIRLTQSFRHGAASLLSFPNNILEGIQSLPPTLHSVDDLQVGDGYFFFPAYDGQFCADLTMQVYVKILSLYKDEDNFNGLHDVQILCPMKRGDAGTERLNEKLRTIVTFCDDNFQVDRYCEEFEDFDYVVGEKVMQIQNNYEKKTMNGDIGKIIRLSKSVGKNDSEKYVYIEFLDDNMVIYDQETEAKSFLQLAYAITVHKSQGSEYKVAIVVIPKGCSNYFVTKKLIYTACTRSSKTILIGDPDTIKEAMTKKEFERHTLLNYHYK